MLARIGLFACNDLACRLLYRTAIFALFLRDVNLSERLIPTCRLQGVRIRERGEAKHMGGRRPKLGGRALDLNSKPPRPRTSQKYELLTTCLLQWVKESGRGEDREGRSCAPSWLPTCASRPASHTLYSAQAARTDTLLLLLAVAPLALAPYARAKGRCLLIVRPTSLDSPAFSRPLCSACPLDFPLAFASPACPLGGTARGVRRCRPTPPRSSACRKRCSTPSAPSSAMMTASPTTKVSVLAWKTSRAIT